MAPVPVLLHPLRTANLRHSEPAPKGPCPRLRLRAAPTPLCQNHERHISSLAKAAPKNRHLTQATALSHQGWEQVGRFGVQISRHLCVSRQRDVDLVVEEFQAA